MEQVGGSSSSFKYPVSTPLRRFDTPSDDGTNPNLGPAASLGLSITPSPEPGAEPPSTGGRRRKNQIPYFHSRRVRGQIEKPWLQNQHWKERMTNILPVVGFVVGLGISGLLVWDGIRSVAKHNYCLVFEDNFTTFNDAVWTKEVQVGGFGNGEFEQTTGGDENVYVHGGRLFIKPTLQDADLINNFSIINLLEDGTCTSKEPSDCIAVTNSTAGNSSLVPPVKSGRINTRKGATIKYGRVEVTAKLPQGDWLWPAIWMMPAHDIYGPWPAGGEIDIMESRGNNRDYAQGGNDIVSSALHWGPDPDHDAWWKTNVKRQALHTTYSSGFNTFGLEWSQNYLFTYVNSRLLQVLYTDFKEPLWERGGFPEATSNGTRLKNTWSPTGRLNTPFDQRFYLILNLAVGGTNGWFENSQSGKPWIDQNPYAKQDFWNSQNVWLPTWTSPAMEVSKVAMWQQCDGNEEL